MSELRHAQSGISRKDANLSVQEGAEEEGRGRISRLLRSRLFRMGLLVVLSIAMAAYWAWGAEGEIGIGEMAQRARRFARGPWGEAIMIGLFLVGGLAMFPVTILFIVSAVVYPVGQSLAISGLGAMTSASLLYLVGRFMGMRTDGRGWGDGQIEKLSSVIKARGVLAVALVRLVPIAPFSLVNMMAGATGVAFVSYTIGTLLGMSPGIVGVTLTVHFASRALLEPSLTSISIAGAAIAVVALAGSLGGAYFRKRARGDTGEEVGD